MPIKEAIGCFIYIQSALPINYINSLYSPYLVSEGAQGMFDPFILITFAWEKATLAGPGLPFASYTPNKENRALSASFLYISRFKILI